MSKVNHIQNMLETGYYEDRSLITLPWNEYVLLAKELHDGRRIQPPPPGLPPGQWKAWFQEEGKFKIPIVIEMHVGKGTFTLTGGKRFSVKPRED